MVRMRIVVTLRRILFISLPALAFSLVPFVASAHEVYVLTPAEIRVGLMTAAFSPWPIIMADLGQFVFWAFISILTVFIVFFASISRWFEKLLDPILLKARHYAPLIARVTVGSAFILTALNHSLFGPELPLVSIFGSFSGAIQFLFIGIGILVIAGWYTRFAAFLALLIFMAGVFVYGSYMLTYMNYLGEIVVLLLIGAHRVGVDRFHHSRESARHALDALAKKAAPYSFLILRIAFGISLLYASLYAKFVHNDLALQVASMPLAGHAHSLASALGFEPHFLVLGAGIIEIVISLFFILGIEIRFTALFLEFWLTLSLLYFGEVVWPHLILIGIPIAFLFYGYDRYSVEGFFFKKGNREPVF